MRFIARISAVLALAACAPSVPNSAAVVDEGVGFRDYGQYTQERLQREAQLQSQSYQTVLPPASVTAPAAAEVQTAAATPAPVITPTRVPTPVATPSTTVAATAPTAATALAPAAAATETTTVAANHPSISDEQDFAAVSERESIESDRERLQQQRAQYQVIQPTAVPTRSGGGGPNIVEYALGTRNAVGQPIYKRARAFAAAKYRRNCAKYVSPDRAQEDFLRNGGPKRDRFGLDPDGDGFACKWDPTPFRRAVN